MNPSQKNVVADGRGGWVEGDHGPAYTPEVGQFAKTRQTILIHLNVEAPAGARLEWVVAEIEASLEAGLAPVISADVVLAEQV